MQVDVGEMNQHFFIRGVYLPCPKGCIAVGLAALKEKKRLTCSQKGQNRYASTKFYANIYSKLECVSNFRFKREYIGIFCDAMDWDVGVKAENGCSVDNTKQFASFCANLKLLFDVST